MVLVGGLRNQGAFGPLAVYSWRVESCSAVQRTDDLLEALFSAAERSCCRTQFWLEARPHPAASVGTDLVEIQLAFALQDIAPAQGQSAPNSASTTAASTPPSGGEAAPPPSDLGMWFPLLMLAPILIVMIWSSRSQQKRQQKAIAELKKGDIVLTQSGFRGKLVELGDRYAKVEIAPGTKVEVLKTAVLGKDSAEAAAQIEKK